MDRTHARRAALEAVDRLINRGGEADEVLRAVVSALRERMGYRFVGIAFVEGGRMELGPAAGAQGRVTTGFPIVFQASPVGELRVEPVPADDGERAFLERVATLVSPYCLVGWDTGGVPWPQLPPSTE
jgi:hypothetical protein